MRIAVLGAGAIGSAVGGLLALAGEDVVLVGRKAHVDAINRHGLIIGGLLGGRHVPVQAAEEMLFTPDLTLLTVKTQDVVATVNSALGCLRRVPILTMQNGVRSDELVAEILGKEQVIGAVVQLPVDLQEPGRVNLRRQGSLTIGAAWVANDQRITEIAAVLDRAVQTRVVDDIRAHRWTKLIGNLINALTAAVGLSVQEVLANAELRRLVVLLTKEGFAVVRRAGIVLNRSSAQAHFHLLERAGDLALEEAVALLAQSEYTLGDPVITSTLQSILKGKPTEIDYLNGEIVRLGNKLGIRTPCNERIVALVHHIEESGKFLSIEELVGALDTSGNIVG